ncbi:hypothetical protein D3C81_1533630 [compost metagenome]
MPGGKQRYVEPDILHSVQEEDHPEQKQQVVVPRHHVLGAHVDERQEHHARAFLNKAFIPLGDGMSQRLGHD